MPKAMTDKEFKQRVKELTGSEYTVIDTYSKSGIKLNIKHNTCGNIWSITPNNFLRGKRCPKCNLKKTTNQYSKEVSALTNGSIILIGKYKGYQKQTEYKCLKHNYIFTNTPKQFLNTTFYCPKCANEFRSYSQRKDENHFLKELSKAHNGSIIALESYKNTHTKIKFKCINCKHIFKSEPNSVLRLSGCPYCRESHGENIIRTYLEASGIIFESQKRFDKCKYKRVLPFDFYIPDKNLLIEYDGLQHSKPVEFFGGYVGYKEQLMKDHIKNNFAKTNKIHLKRIMYVNDKEKLVLSLKKCISNIPSNKVVTIS